MATIGQRVAAASLLALALGACAGPAPRPADRPNVVLFLIDDLGWMDLACQGNARLHTPNIDRLASQGMRFTDAYAAAPVCSPTRAAVLTGLAPARLHITTHIPDRFVPEGAALLPAKTLDHLPLERVTIAERLKAAGYATGFFGKWHLAGHGTRADGGRGKPAFYPERQGFDLNVGGCAYGGPPTYFDPYRIHNLPGRRKGEYLPDRLSDESVAFIRANKDRPFFLNLWHYTVHWPMEAKPEHLAKYAGKEGPGIKDTRYAAMIEGLDDAVGRVLAALDAAGVADRTLVIFTSDNGGYSGVADNRPLREGKGYLYEGGIRVPLAIRWPGVVRAGTTCRVPVVSMDFFPTILAAAGLKPDTDTPLDGESLMPLLRGTGGLARKALYFHFPNYAWHKKNRLGGAIREGDYKLIERYEDGSVELYNVAKDVGETEDLATREPGRAEEMKRKLRVWLKETDAQMPARKER